MIQNPLLVPNELFQISETLYRNLMMFIVESSLWQIAPINKYYYLYIQNYPESSHIASSP